MYTAVQKKIFYSKIPENQDYFIYIYIYIYIYISGGPLSALTWDSYRR